MKLIRNTVYGGTWVPDHCNDRGPRMWNADTYAGGMIHDVVRLIPDTNRNVALDLGANVGLTTLGMAHYFDKVLAFEADPLTFECLIKNTETKNNIQCHNYAISNKAETLLFSRVIGISGHTHIHKKDREKEEFELFEASSRRLNEFLQSTQQIDFIKMDIEGMESIVINDNLDLFSQHKPFLLIEIAHDYHKTFDRIYMSLRKVGYVFGWQVANKRDFIFIHSSYRKTFNRYRSIVGRERNKVTSYSIT